MIYSVFYHRFTLKNGTVWLGKLALEGIVPKVNEKGYKRLFMRQIKLEPQVADEIVNKTTVKLATLMLEGKALC